MPKYFTDSRDRVPSASIWARASLMAASRVALSSP